jgi:hypothetical protein
MLIVAGRPNFLDDWMILADFHTLMLAWVLCEMAGHRDCMQCMLSSDFLGNRIQLHKECNIGRNIPTPRHSGLFIIPMSEEQQYNGDFDTMQECS